MADIFNDDFQDFIRCINDCKVKYILVGGYSVIIHGHSRSTGDMDIWVEKTSENYQKIVQSFLKFGMPVFDMTENKFLKSSAEYDVFRFGVPPRRIDLMTAVKGLHFDEAYEKAEWIDIEGVTIKVIHYTHLIEAKKAAGRRKDLDDIENLESGEHN